MKIGILANGFRRPLAESLDLAARLGVSGIQLSPKFLDKNLLTASVAERSGWARQIRDLGLEVSAMTCPAGQKVQIPEERDIALEEVRRTIDVALEFGARIATGHITTLDDAPASPAWREAVTGVRAMVTIAAGAGCRFGIETGREPAAVLLKFIREVGHEACCVNFDPANLVMLMGESPAEAVGLLGSHVIHTHAKDGVKHGDWAFADVDKRWQEARAKQEPFDWHQYLSELPLGQGTVDFPAYLARLKAAGFDGYLTIEREEGEDRVGDIAHAVEFLKRCLAGIR